MTGQPPPVTNRLAQFIADTQREGVPPEVRREGVRALLNFVGCALGGTRDAAMDIAVKVLTPFFGPPQAIVIGRGERPDALNAAFLNSVSANVLEYDDTYLLTAAMSIAASRVPPSAQPKKFSSARAPSRRTSGGMASHREPATNCDSWFVTSMPSNRLPIACVLPELIF